MKPKLFVTAFFAVSSMMISCSRSLVSEMEIKENNYVELTANLENAFQTKGQTAWTKQQESTVGSWQLFVFNEDGTLDVCGKTTGSGSISLTCTAGKKKAYALVNGQGSLVGSDGVKTEAELLAEKSLLSENTAGTSFVMFGKDSLVLTASTTLAISVDRLCAKVYIDGIVNNLPGAYGAITVKGIYLTNVAGDAVFGNKAYLPETSGKWYNKMGYHASGDSAVEALLSETSLSEKIEKNASSTKSHYFYCYPNKSKDTSHSGQWSPRCTRLVVETVIEGDSEERRYYVMNLFGDGGNGVERNKYYHIKKLTINHLGSTDPDEEVESGDVTFSVTVGDWTKGFEKDIDI